jgi:hypothetical protein
MLTGMLNRPRQADMNEWQGEPAEQSMDSVLGFLFANQETDLARELAP